MQLVDWLDDLCVRFIINLQQEELQGVERICFQVEEAQWFYEDFIRPLDPTLPSLNLRQFCLLIFQRCPMLSSYSEHHHLAAFEEFLTYKTRVPVRGAIMLNDAMDEVLLVKGWKKSANWSFPRGKINKDERDLDCAIREAYEETGFDLAAAGLVPDEANVKYIEVTMREQHMKLFVFRGVPQDIEFIPRTRKEISKIQWYKLATLPGYRKNKHAQHHEDALNANKLYMVSPFLGPLKKSIAQQKKHDAQRLSANHSSIAYNASGMATDDYITDDYAMQPIPQVASHTNPPSEWDPRPAQRSEAFWQNETTPAFSSNIPSSTDASAQLKQLLSVGGPSNAPNPSQLPVTSTTASSADLLALLRQGSSPATDAPGQPKTPFGQISHGAIEPKSPHHHHTRPPPPSSNVGLPPAFPYSPSQLGNDPRLYQQHLINDTTTPTPTSTNTAGLDSFGNPVYHSSDLNPQLPGHSIQSILPNPLSSQTPINQQNKNTHQNADNLKFHRDRSFTDTQAGTAPSASTLPHPKLSDHHMSLLSAFKTTNKSSPGQQQQQQQPQQQAAVLEQSIGTRSMQVSDDKESIGLPAIGQSTAEYLKRQPSAKPSSIPATIGPPPVSPDTNTLVRQPVKRPTAQQNTLLDLFRGPNILKAAELPAVKTPTEQVELPAVKSPGPTIQSTQSFPHVNPSQVVDAPRAPKSPKLPRSPTSRPKSPRHPRSPKQPGSPSRHAKLPANDKKTASPRLASATLSGPFDLPEFASVRQKRQHNKGNRNSSHSPHHQERSSPQKAAAPAAAPIQILKRPTSAVTSEPSTKQVTTKPAKDDTSQPPAAAATAGGRRGTAKGAKAEPSKPFQPQILRRPQPSTFAASSPEHSAKAPPKEVVTAHSQSTSPVVASSASPKPPAASTTILKRQDSSTASDHKQTLLSLFGQPKSAALISSPIDIENRSTMTASPSSILPASVIGAQRRPSEGAASRSGANSSNAGSTDGRTAPFTGGAGGVASAARSRISSVTSLVKERTRSGSQTPISPSDRGFLLNYLDGVVKNASSSSSVSAATASQKPL